SATSDGMLRLAELFERQDPPDPEQFKVKRGSVRRTWTMRPGRWLAPTPQDDATYHRLRAELQAYFKDDRGGFDETAFWWLAACAVYPAVRWDLTVYLGLRLRAMPSNSAADRGLRLYTEDRALRLAELPWFRSGFMPNWLRRRLFAELPETMRAQVALLLNDLLKRAV